MAEFSEIWVKPDIVGGLNFWNPIEWIELALNKWKILTGRCGKPSSLKFLSNFLQLSQKKFQNFKKNPEL